MFLLIHALVGEALGIYFHSAALIILIGILGHFLLDMVPHWDGNFDREHFKNYSVIKCNKKLVYLRMTEVIATFMFIYFIYTGFGDKFMLLGAIASILPDLANIGYFTKLKNKKSYNKYLQFHSGIQKDCGLLFGLLTQLVVFVVFMKILI
jgi:hypothetical protein